MELIEIPSREFDFKEFVKRSALETDYRRLVRNDTMVDGVPAIIYRKLGWDFRGLLRTLQSIEYSQNERTGGLKTTSRVFGYQPRVTVRRDFCASTSLATHNPAANDMLCEFGRRVQDVYFEHFPQVAERHARMAREKILPDWLYKGSCFSSGIVNKNNPLKYHFDAGNFEKVCSCMLAFKYDIKGGYLAVPEFDMAFEIADASLLIFDGQSIMHGVTPITKLSDHAYRYSIVYYTLQQMWNCEPLTAELARVQTLRTVRERKRAGIVPAEEVVDLHSHIKSG